MSHPLVEVATFSNAASCVVPDDGDPRNAASVVGAFQELANRTAYLKNGGLGTRDVTGVSLPFGGAFFDPAEWATFGATYTQTDVSGTRVIFWDLDLPHNVTITDLKIWLSGTTHLALPATKPIFTFQWQALSTGAITTITNATDASASVGAYNASHNIDLAVSHVVDASRRYQVKLSGETGANSEASKLVVGGLAISWTAP